MSPEDKKNTILIVCLTEYTDNLAFILLYLNLAKLKVGWGGFKGEVAFAGTNNHELVFFLHFLQGTLHVMISKAMKLLLPHQTQTGEEAPLFL